MGPPRPPPLARRLLLLLLRGRHGTCCGTRWLLLRTTTTRSSSNFSSYPHPGVRANADGRSEGGEDRGLLRLLWGSLRAHDSLSGLSPPKVQAQRNATKEGSFFESQKACNAIAAHTSFCCSATGPLTLGISVA
jgi:hypothetical protein